MFIIIQTFYYQNHPVRPSVQISSTSAVVVSVPEDVRMSRIFQARQLVVLDILCDVIYSSSSACFQSDLLVSIPCSFNELFFPSEVTNQSANSFSQYILAGQEAYRDLQFVIQLSERLKLSFNILTGQSIHILRLIVNHCLDEKVLII